MRSLECAHQPTAPARTGKSTEISHDEINHDEINHGNTPGWLGTSLQLKSVSAGGAISFQAALGLLSGYELRATQGAYQEEK